MQNSALAGLSILIVEDEALLRKQIAAQLEHLGADVTGIGTLSGARKLIEDLGLDIVLLDVNLPDGHGTDLLKQNAFAANTGVIVMTADGGVGGAVEAMKLGALDYLVKPFDAGELPLVIGRARRARQSARIEEYRRSDGSSSGEIFFFGSTLAGLQSQLEKILAADQRVESELPPVLILGETGTGKTTIARWLHHHGPRAEQPLIEVNCSALPETLAESELFGHERGAFTDARVARMGLFEAANGGTLFLDELPSLTLPLQAKVLTAIEDHKIRRLGGNKTIPVDARAVAATNRDLKQLVATGQFREDLYHRLDLYRISIPALRERGEDILTLAEQLMSRLCQRHRLPPRTISAVGRKRLMAYPWPGNVRELAHELERTLVFEESERLDFEHLLAATERAAASPGANTDWLNDRFVFPPEGFSLEAAINRLLQLALAQTSQNVSAAARLLGVSRDYVRYRLAGQKKTETGGN
ncbi:MAG: sigma-54 dependent transcriptional regulator [Verrucomicrobia bacterium]|nr:sigma-54 dependent transcriptional regulator [Verrucomicrobiota bacterium]